MLPWREHRRRSRSPDGPARKFAAAEADRSTVDLLVESLMPGRHDAVRRILLAQCARPDYGTDMTGRTTADFPGHIALFFTALYLAALRRGEWVLSEHEPPRQVFVRAWRRLIVPLVNRTDAPKRLIALNTAENELRAGLELLVDPVFLVDENRVVHYANRSARLLFGISKRPDARATLSEMTSFALSLAMSPTEMLGQRRVQRDVEMTVLQKVIHRFAVTVSPAVYRQSVFYVVVCRKLLY